MREEIITDHVLRNLLLSLADNSESIRELSLSTFCYFVEQEWFNEKDIDHIVKALAERIQSQPFKEPTEEIRTLVIKGFSLICRPKYRNVLQHNLSLFAKSISNVMADKNPESKKESAKCISQYCKMFKDKMGLFGKTLILNICQNLNHSHSKVRKPTIVCLFDLLMCDFASSLIRDFPDVFNILVKLSIDKNLEIKEIITEKIIEYQRSAGHTDLQEVEHYVLTLILVLTNENPKDFIDHDLNSTRIETYYERDEKIKEEMLPFEEKFADKPHKNTHILFCKFRNQIIDLLIDKYLFWWTHMPFQVVFLKTIQKYFEFTLNAMEPKKLHGFFENINKYFNVESINQKKADDLVLVKEICNTYNSIGNVYDLSTLLDLLIYPKTKNTEKDFIDLNINLRIKTYVVLFYVLQGKSMASDIVNLIEYVSKETYMDVDNTSCSVLIPHYYQLLNFLVLACTEISKTESNSDGREGCLDEQLILLLFDTMIKCHSVLNLYKDQLYDVFSPQILGTQHSIVDLYQNRYNKSIYELYIEERLDGIIESHAEWNKYSHEFYTFCDLIKSCGHFAMQNLEKFLLPMCFVCVNFKDLEIRQYVLEIVEFISMNYGFNFDTSYKKDGGDHDPRMVVHLIEAKYDLDENYKKLVDYGFVILTQIIFSNLYWKPGKALYSLRKSSLVVLRSLIKYGVINHMNLHNLYRNDEGKDVKALHELYAIMSSSLDEDYGFDARILAISSLQELFLVVEMSYDDCFFIYDRLLKRLDDSNDAVRVIACKALENMFYSARSNFASSPLEYCVKTMLVHLDDQNVDVYDAVNKSLQALIRTNDKAEERDCYSQLQNAHDKNYNKTRTETLLKYWLKYRKVNDKVNDKVKDTHETEVENLD